MSADDAAAELAAAPWAAALGVELRAIAPDAAELALPFRAGNTNPGGVLHGGVAASLVAMAGRAVARATLGADGGPLHTWGLQVAYLAAARQEAVRARARRLRAGRELVFVDVGVEGEDGRAIAHGLAVVRGRGAAPPVETPLAAGDHGASDPGPMGPHIGRMPFTQRLGLQVEHMAGGTSRIALPFRPENGDGAGGVHEGAVLALLDTTGAMAAWAVTGPGAFKASTPSLQARILAPPPAADLFAFGRCLHRDGEAFACDVEIASAATRRVHAQGTVLYRILPA